MCIIYIYYIYIICIRALANKTICIRLLNTSINTFLPVNASMVEIADMCHRLNLPVSVLYSIYKYFYILICVYSK